jgi:signal peptide peptidase SppA
MPDKLEAICAFISMKISGGSAAPDIVAAIKAQNEVSAARAQNVSTAGAGAVAVIPIYGIINQRYSGDFSGPSGTSIQNLTQQFRQALNDPNVKAIIFDIDSPGGSVSGVDEFAAEVFQARGKKKISAVSNTLCASAAYYIGSQATEFCVSPSSLTGSIGVYSAHEDDSVALEKIGIKVSLISAGKYKVEGNNFEPLGDDARMAMQKMVDDYYGMFVAAIARGRGVKAGAVKSGFGEGRVLTAKDAVESGMADKVASLDDVLASYGVKQQGSATSAKAGTGRVAKLQSMRSESATGVTDSPSADYGDCDCPCESCQAGDCSGCDCEGCESESCGNQDCSCAGHTSDDDDPDASVKVEAEARERRLRLARL